MKRHKQNSKNHSYLLNSTYFPQAAIKSILERQFNDVVSNNINYIALNNIRYKVLEKLPLSVFWLDMRNSFDYNWRDYDRKA